VVGGDPEPGQPEQAKLDALIAELDLAGSVSLLGLRTDVPQILTAIDVAALSSDYEGSPLSVMEYMEAGKPVVATRVGGIPDLVVDGETGLLTEPQDPAALAAAVGQLLRDPARARGMGTAGRERRRREFTIEATAQRIGDLYLDLRRRRGPAGES
jgi:glycosyltransferase involved in cell wall biosynthesis